MPIIHDKFVIELKEVIKGFGNDPQVKDPLRFPCDYKFYEIDGVAICENSFKKMKQLEDVAIPKADYENRLKADMVAMLEDLRLDFQEAELAGELDNKELIFADEADDLIQQKINSLKEDTNQ